MSDDRIPHAKKRHHKPKLSANQCSSYLVQTIDAPLPLVRSLVRRFDNPQGYKQFVRKCTMLNGDGGVGSVREVVVMSGLPAAVSIERSTTTLHEEEDGRRAKTVVIESHVAESRTGDGTWKPWGRLEAWRERGSSDGLGYRFEPIPDTNMNAAGVVLAESTLSSNKGGKFLIDLGAGSSNGRATPGNSMSPVCSPRSSGDFGYVLWPYCLYRGGFMMSASVESEYFILFVSLL